MTSIKKLVFLSSTSILFALGGCSTVVKSGNYALSKAIVKDSDRLNDSYNKATNGVIVKNILRARDRVPTNFTTLSGIQSTPQITNTSALLLSPLGIGNPNSPGPLQSSTDTLTNQVRSQNQYNINPFAGGGGRTESLLFDISESTFERYWKSWPKDVVFLMFVESVSTGESDLNPCKNNGNKFNKFMDCLKEKMGINAGEVDFNKIYFDIPFERKNRHQKLEVKNKQLCSGEKMSLTSIISKKENLETLEKLISTSNFSLKLIDVQTSGDAQNEDVKPVFDVCRDIDETGKIFVYGHPSDGSSPELSVSYRSFDDIIYYLGETLRFDHLLTASNAYSEDQLEYLLAKRPKVKDACRPGREASKAVPLIRFHSKFSPVNNYLELPNSKFAVSINHSGQNYNALPILNEHGHETWNLSGNSSEVGCMGERTSTVMSILNQLLLLNQSATFLQAPENTIIQ